MPYYEPSRVSYVVGLDPALQLHRLALKRIARTGIDVELVGVSAESIPLENSSIDTVVVTYSLCTIPDPLAALKEMRRVLVPGGRLLFCEHGRAPDENVRRWQARLQPYWQKIAGGCHLDRDVPALLTEAGFRCDTLQTRYLPGPRLLTFNYLGEARAA